MPKVSAIVPVFNEEKTIGKVVETLLRSPVVNEVICVYDHSSDNSLDVLKSFEERIKLVVNKERKGKGFALAEGVRVVKGEIVAFFDADLITLTEKHVSDLITPLIEGQAKATLGNKGKDRPRELLKDLKLSVAGDSLTYQIGHLFPYLISTSLTGERAFFRKDLLPHLDKMKETRFGVEVFFNNQFKDVTEVKMPGLCGILKFEKFSFHEAIQRYIEEAVEVAQEMGRQEKVRLQDLRILGAIGRARYRFSPGRLRGFDRLQGRVAKIQNERVRRFLSGYIEDVARLASRLKNSF